MNQTTNQWNGICIIAEHRNGTLSPITLELLGQGKTLALAKPQEVSVVILGHEITPLVEELAHYEVDKVVYLNHPLLQEYTTEGYTRVLGDYLQEAKPEIVLMAATSYGRDFGPRLAAKLGTGLTADCTQLEIADDILKQTLPSFGGQLMATIICPTHRPQMATVRPGVMKMAAKTDGASPVQEQTPALVQSDFKIQVLERIQQLQSTCSLADAEILVAGGRGVGSKEGFDLLRRLANALGGEVAATRPAVDNGWIEPEHMVGQTGTTVKPKVYIACGISGAIQHTSGMDQAQCIVSINQNPHAPINQIAHYVIHDDLFAVVNQMLQQLEQN